MFPNRSPLGDLGLLRRPFAKIGLLLVSFSAKRSPKIFFDEKKICNIFQIKYEIEYMHGICNSWCNQYFITFVCVVIHINPVVWVGVGSGVICLEESIYMHGSISYDPKWKSIQYLWCCSFPQRGLVWRMGPLNSPLWP